MLTQAEPALKKTVKTEKKFTQAEPALKKMSAQAEPALKNCLRQLSLR
jgi:hypothetical protein